MAKNIINLNLITTYPVKWNMYKILRDFIQNFYDSVSNTEFSERFSYEYKNQCLIMSCKDVSYSYEWLLHIGASSKTMDNEKSYAGYFGEGFKIAALCAMRDYGLEVETNSSNWGIKVIEQPITIDGNPNKSLAYEIEINEKHDLNTVLKLKNFKEEHLEIFYCALYSFYYEDNPLFGKKIFSNNRCAIYERSPIKKHFQYPSSFNSGGDGIIFAGFQARGSIKESIIFCYHDYHDNDRDRDFFSEIDNIDIMVRCIREISHKEALKLLILLKKYWYSYPKEQFGYRSYYTVIKNLIFKVEEDKFTSNSFIEQFPKLLYARKIPASNKRALNERKYCLSWLKKNSEYTLVQDSFWYLNVESLEGKCKDEKALPIVDRPTENELNYIGILREFVEEIFEGFLEVDSLPRCNIIRNITASVSGYAELQQSKEKKKNSYGYKYRYEVNSICLKEKHLSKNCFSEALTVYIHELCHTFGGDKSESFSYAMTDALEVVINNPQAIEKYKAKWESLKTS